MEDCFDKTSYVSPTALVIEIKGRCVLCSSFDGSSGEGIGWGDSYDDNDYD